MIGFQVASLTVNALTDTIAVPEPSGAVLPGTCVPARLPVYQSGK